MSVMEPAHSILEIVIASDLEDAPVWFAAADFPCVEHRGRQHALSVTKEETGGL